jgi:hypothetical protein
VVFVKSPKSVFWVYRETLNYVELRGNIDMPCHAPQFTLSLSKGGAWDAINHFGYTVN